MTDSGDGSLPVRRYNDDEVRELLARAARMQGRAPAPVRQQGLTLEQIAEIAAEAQIDPARLVDAARQLDLERANHPSGFVERAVGAPRRIHVEHTLPFEIDPAALGSLVHVLADVSGDSGASNLVGRTFTWNVHAASGRRLEVRVTTQRGRTHVLIEERYGETIGALFGGVLGGAGGGIGLGIGGAVATSLGSVAAGIAFPIAVVGISYGACRFGFAKYVRGRTRRISALLDRIVDEIRSLHEHG